MKLKCEIKSIHLKYKTVKKMTFANTITSPVKELNKIDGANFSDIFNARLKKSESCFLI
jgi:hypothetical protein